jgi:hypothetical protein
MVEHRVQTLAEYMANDPHLMPGTRVQVIGKPEHVMAKNKIGKITKEAEFPGCYLVEFEKRVRILQSNGNWTLGYVISESYENLKVIQPSEQKSSQ